MFLISEILSVLFLQISSKWLIIYLLAQICSRKMLPNYRLCFFLFKIFTKLFELGSDNILVRVSGWEKPGFLVFFKIHYLLLQKIIFLIHNLEQFVIINLLSIAIWVVTVSISPIITCLRLMIILKIFSHKMKLFKFLYGLLNSEKLW